MGVSPVPCRVTELAFPLAIPGTRRSSNDLTYYGIEFSILTFYRLIPNEVFVTTLFPTSEYLRHAAEVRFRVQILRESGRDFQG